MDPAVAAPTTSSGRLADNVLEELWFADDDPKRSHVEASRSLAAAAATAAGLKPFPAVASRVIQLTERGDVSAAQLAETIGSDPALTARLLRVTNSAVYSRGTQVQDVSDAIVRLGVRTVRDIVVGAASLGLFRDSKGFGMRVRNHCAGVAGIARTLATEARVQGVPAVFLAGLLHDLGVLLLMQVRQIDYGALPLDVLQEADRLHIAEREQLGFDHAVLGAHVLTNWRIPSTVCRLVAWHHQPARAFALGGEVGSTVALMRVADKIESLLTLDEPLAEDTVHTIAKSADGTYLGIGADILWAMLPKLEAARSEMQSTFSA